MKPEQQQAEITAENVPIAALGAKIINPGFVASAVLDIIRSAETRDVGEIIQTLNSGNPLPLALSAAAAARTAPSTTTQPAANRVYYFEIAPGTWTGAFTFRLTNWRKLWAAGMSSKNKLLAAAMHVFHSIFGDASIVSVVTPYPERGLFGVAHNSIHIHKGWFTLLRSEEDYTLHPDGRRVSVDAHVRFGPVPFLFREHDRYPASVIDGGMRNLYHIKLLGTRFLGDYQVQPDRRHVASALTNAWAVTKEILTAS